MKIIVDGKRYGVTMEKNTLSESIAAMCPMTLDMNRSGGHEYYAALTGSVKTAGASQTSQVKRSGVYYFAAWNAFSLVFQDASIEPYSVHIIGQADSALADVLDNAQAKLKITIEE